jgi:hypothetical protein
LFELLSRQLSGLERNRVRDRKLADVVKRRCLTDQRDLGITHSSSA